MNRRTFSALRARVLPHLPTFFSFGAIQAAQVLVPLLALPWLARKLGPDAFGLLMYMGLIPVLVALVMDWGFPLGAAREAAFSRGGDEAGQARLLGGVFAAKILLALFCVCGSALALPLVPHASGHPLAYGLAVLMGLARGASPVWFFQGAGYGMRRMACWDVSTSACVLALTFLCIHEAGQWPLYLLFLALCKGTTYLWLSWALMRSRGAHLNFAHGWAMLRRTRTLFVGSLAGTLYNSGTQMVLGYFLPAADMGLLVAASKIVRAVVSLMQPVTQTIFPEICALRGRHSDLAARVLRWSLALTVGGMLLAAALCWLTAPLMISIALGAGYAAAVPVLRVMSLVLPLLGADTVLGSQGLIPLGLEKRQVQVQLLMGGISLPLAAFLGWRFGLAGGAWLPVLVESGIFAGLVFCILRFCPGALVPGARCCGGSRP